MIWVPLRSVWSAGWSGAAVAEVPAQYAVGRKACNLGAGSSAYGPALRISPVVYPTHTRRTAGQKRKAQAGAEYRQCSDSTGAADGGHRSMRDQAPLAEPLGNRTGLGNVTAHLGPDTRRYGGRCRRSARDGHARQRAGDKLVRAAAHLPQHLPPTGGPMRPSPGVQVPRVTFRCRAGQHAEHARVLRPAEPMVEYCRNIVDKHDRVLLL
jgi:hypothetical protein